MNQEDQSEVISETSKALHIEPSKEGFFYFMIFTNIDYLADYHTLRDFKPKKGGLDCTVSNHGIDLENPLNIGKKPPKIILSHQSEKKKQ